MSLGRTFCAFFSECFFSESCVLFTGRTSTFFSKNNFKIGSHSIINKFKNYFTTIFLIFNNKRYLNKSIIKCKASKRSEIR